MTDKFDDVRSASSVLNRRYDVAQAADWSGLTRDDVKAVVDAADAAVDYEAAAEVWADTISHEPEQLSADPLALQQARRIVDAALGRGNE